MASPEPIIVPQTAAITTPVQVNCNETDMVTFVVTGTLATTETITINIMTTNPPPNNFQPYFTGGAVAALTATVPSITVQGGVLYGLTKLISASAAGCDANFKPRQGVQ